LRAALSDVDRLGWDSAPGDAVLRYARTEVVRVAVSGARLRGPAADDAASTGWAAAWKILNKPGLRHEPSPWGLVAAAVRREVSGTSWPRPTAPTATPPGGLPGCTALPPTRRRGLVRS